MADLLIRAAMIDHNVVSDVLAPGSGPRLVRRPLISQLVADAHVAMARPVLADLARSAGIPYLVDPDTTFLQSDVAPDDRWAKLPYATAKALRPADIDQDRLIEEVMEFELDRGATVLIPPYFYATSPVDPWFLLTLSLIDNTADYLDRQGIKLPVLPILCAQLQSFGTAARWSAGVDRFVERVVRADINATALCLSPSGAGSDGYGKVMRLFETALRVKGAGLRTLAWRQGIYGPALVAAGLDGYECGMGTGEQTDVVRRQSSRKPQQKESGNKGGGAGIYFETLGRSVPRRVGQILLGNVAMKPKVMCDVETCCPNAMATLDHSRHHAVRSRSRQLRTLEKQPRRIWRLNSIANEASSAATLAAQANKLLAAENSNQQIKTKNLDAIAAVAKHLADTAYGSQSA